MNFTLAFFVLFDRASNKNSGVVFNIGPPIMIEASSKTTQMPTGSLARGSLKQGGNLDWAQRLHQVIYMWLCIIEDAMRRDTAAPSFWDSACRALFRGVVFAGLCLAIVWLILFDLV